MSLLKLYILASYVIPGVILGIVDLHRYPDANGPSTLISCLPVLPPMVFATINAEIAKQVHTCEHPALVVSHGIHFLYFSFAVFSPLRRAIVANGAISNVGEGFIYAGVLVAAATLWVAFFLSFGSTHGLGFITNRILARPPRPSEALFPTHNTPTAPTCKCVRKPFQSKRRNCTNAGNGNTENARMTLGSTSRPRRVANSSEDVSEAVNLLDLSDDLDQNPSNSTAMPEELLAAPEPVFHRLRVSNPSPFEPRSGTTNNISEIQGPSHVSSPFNLWSGSKKSIPVTNASATQGSHFDIFTKPSDSEDRDDSLPRFTAAQKAKGRE